jgi:hypothetical protein
MHLAARTCPVTREPATRSMSGQCVITLFRLTLLHASGSSGPYPPEPLVREVAEAGGEVVAEQGEQAEHHVGVGGVVGGHHLRLRPGVQVQQGLQDVQGVARGAGHDHLPDACDLVVQAFSQVMPRLKW